VTVYAQRLPSPCVGRRVEGAAVLCKLGPCRCDDLHEFAGPLAPPGG